MYFLAESFEVSDLSDFVFSERCWLWGVVFLFFDVIQDCRLVRNVESSCSYREKRRWLGLVKLQFGVIWDVLPANSVEISALTLLLHPWSSARSSSFWSHISWRNVPSTDSSSSSTTRKLAVICWSELKSSVLTILIARGGKSTLAAGLASLTSYLQ